MLRILLAKDLRRTWRNPAPLLISLLLPFMITGLVGLAFAPRGGQPALRISLALVDEDDSPLTQFLQGGVNQEEARETLDVQLLDRAEAMRRVTDNAIAAVVIVPKGFSEAYLNNRVPPPLEVIKNPAQGIPPAIVEEGVQVLVTFLNAGARILGEDFASVRTLFAEEQDFITVLANASIVLVNARAKLETARDFLTPPLVQYATETKENPAQENTTTMGDVFGFLLIGMMGMFLPMMADTALRDLYRETRFRTLERYRTMHDGLLTFITGKAAFAFATQWIGIVAFVGGGMLIFGVTWERLREMFVLIFAYTIFAAGFMGLLSALAGHERRADALNSIVIMMLAAAGGCMFPPQNFPAFLREGVMPWLPTAWFASTGRALQNDAVADWWIAAVKLAGVGVLSLVVATMIFRRRLEQGVKV